MRGPLRSMAAALGLVCLLAGRAMAGEPALPTDYTRAIERASAAIRDQMQKHGIAGISAAMVDDQRVVYLAGYGTADKDSVFRAGSISKLFNAVAIVQLVREGKLDLDAPIRRYGPQFSLVVPMDSAPAVTLRQLLCHRAGVVRESPVGGYLDDSQPSLAATVAAARSCPLLNPPSAKTRYSNVGPSIAGQVLATVAATPYEKYQQENVLRPLGMTHSSFVLKGIRRDRLLPGFMRIADGRGGFTRGEAPLFDLGTLPAGNLYTTAGDLAKFLSMLAAGGRAGGKEVLSPEMLAKMATPQLVDAPTGFGLGFMVDKFRSHKSLSHMGAVYGYTSSLMFLPDPKIGVVVLSNEDIATGPISKLASTALGLMVEAKLGEKPPEAEKPLELLPQDLSALAGQYESPSHWARIEAAGGRLTGNLSGQPITLTPVTRSEPGPKSGNAPMPILCLADGRLLNSAPFEFERDATGRVVGFTAMSQKFTRVDPGAVPEPPPLWSEFCGRYGPSFIPLVVGIRHGHLYATIENELDYRLIPAGRHVFLCPPGMYREEYLIFTTDPAGRVHGAEIANMYLRRWSK